MTSGPYFLAGSTPAVAGAFWLLLITTQILEDHSFVANGYFFRSGVCDMCGTREHILRKHVSIVKVPVCLKPRKRLRTTAVSPVFQELFFL